MPEQDKTSTGEAVKVDVAEIVKQATVEVGKVLTAKYDQQIADLTKNVGVLADTLKNAPPATATKAGDAKPEPLTAELVSKLIADALAADRKTRDDDGRKSADRQKLIDKVAKEKLGGNAELAKLLSGDDEAAINTAADALAAQIKTYKPDFGGATKDGGTPPGSGKVEPKLNPNLPPGVAKFAAAIQPA